MSYGLECKCYRKFQENSHTFEKYQKLTSARKSATKEELLGWLLASGCHLFTKSCHEDSLSFCKISPIPKLICNKNGRYPHMTCSNYVKCDDSFLGLIPQNLYPPGFLTEGLHKKLNGCLISNEF